MCRESGTRRRSRFPTKPQPYDLQGVTEDALIDFTPELRAEAVQMLAIQTRSASSRRRHSARWKVRSLAFRSSGGTNWPGGSYDPETRTLYVPSFKSFPVIGLMKPPNREFSDMDYVSGRPIAAWSIYHGAR